MGISNGIIKKRPAFGLGRSSMCRYQYFGYISIIAFSALLFVLWTFRSEAIERLPVFLSNVAETSFRREQLLRSSAHYRRKSLELRNALRGENLNFANMLTYLIPQIVCPWPVRVGNIGDGGKWVCSPWNVLSTNAYPNASVVYSLGVSGDTSFESEMYEILDKKCQIFCFDIVDQKADIFESFNGTFKRWRISSETNVGKSEYTIDDVIKTLGHRRIDFLKIDIEGGEYDLGSSFLNSEMMTNGSVCQIFIEMHNKASGDVGRWIRLFENLVKSRFLLFYKEHNYYSYPAHEFSFIHESCLKLFGIKESPLLYLFD